jgi:DNA-binding MarR family transcriptional regulator
MNIDEMFLETMQLFNRIVNKIILIENKPKKFGTGDFLHRSEIHHIDMIGEKKGINIILLAESMGLTKGTTSQIISRLVRKRLVEKYKHRDNEKEVLLRLTARGITAYRNHKEYHADLYREIKEEASRMSREEIHGLTNILEKIDYYLDMYER